ncbi:putative glucan endo-1-3-beta-glucosidase [Nymphaea thermarum]|nr:putative glucan endo-1-3-beta-glucosidase [Nymphaea thermarum]
MVPNQAIVNISASERAAHTWVRTNLLPFYRCVRIRTLLVGNEVLSDHANRPTWFHLVPAMHNIKLALASLCIRNVKVSTTFAMDTLESSFPLSRGTFRRDIAVPVVLPLLNPNLIPLDYADALFRTAKPTYIDPINGLRYTNLQ